MSGEAREFSGVEARLNSARRALSDASSDEAIARAFTDECDATVDRIALVHDSRREPLSMLAARVTLGELSSTRLLAAFGALEYSSPEYTRVVVEALRDDELPLLLRPPFGPARVSIATLIEELHRRGLYGLALTSGSASPLRPLNASWGALCAKSTPDERAIARRSIDAMLEGRALDDEPRAPTEQRQRVLLLLALCDRALLEDPSARGPLNERAAALIEGNAALLGMYSSEAAPRALLAISLVECGAVGDAIAQLQRAIAASVTASVNAAWVGGRQVLAALRALQRTVSPEQLRVIEASIVDVFSERSVKSATSWFDLARALETPVRERALLRALSLREENHGRADFWIDDARWAAPLCADSIAAAVSRLSLLASRYGRGGVSWDAVTVALQMIPASGPWVESCARALGAALCHRTEHVAYSVRLALRWLLTAARRGSDEAKRALVSIAEQRDLPWHADPRWYRGLDETTVRAMLRRPPTDSYSPRIAWLNILLAQCSREPALLRTRLDPLVRSLCSDGYLLRLIAPYLRPEREHEIVCAALDQHSRSMNLRWSDALLELSLHGSNTALAAKCLRRYLSNVGVSAFDRVRLARATARLGGDARVRLALSRAFAKRFVPAELRSKPERIEWLRSLASADSLDESLWEAVSIARNGLDDDASRAALALAVDALITRAPLPPFARLLIELLPWASPSALSSLIASLPRAPQWAPAWSELIAQTSVRAPSLFVVAMRGYEELSYAKRAMPNARWTRALIDRFEGDAAAIERTFAAVKLVEFSAHYYRVLRAFGWADELVDAVVRAGDNGVALSLSYFATEHLSAEQRARLRPRWAALALTVKSRAEIERFAPWIDRATLARAWSQRVIQSNAEMPSAALVLAMAGDSALERVRSAVVRELRAQCD